jgi:hypothetical protein
VRAVDRNERGVRRHGRPDETDNPDPEAPMIRFFTRLFARRTPAARRTARRVSLRVESLETRETPSGLLNPVQNLVWSRETEGRHPMSQTEKLTIKRNVLTLHNLPAGNYTESFSPHR